MKTYKYDMQNTGGGRPSFKIVMIVGAVASEEGSSVYPQNNPQKITILHPHKKKITYRYPSLVLHYCDPNYYFSTANKPTGKTK